MAELPLLLFPRPEIADWTRRPPGFGRVKKPNHTRQGQRLSPKFSQLQRTFEIRRVEVQQTTTGIDPEQVLVIETIGSIENFANAVKKIEGLEWMGEVEVDEIAPDEDFYIQDKPEKELSGRLYLVMTNQTALNQMLSLWRQYREDPNMTFQRGLTKFRDVFLCLKDIRRWDVQDRFSETGVIEAWLEDLKYEENEVIRFETELWYRKSDGRRTQSESQVKHLIEDSNGRIVSQCVVNEIAYHSLLVELPRNSVQDLVDHSATELVKCDDIMFFRPIGQMATDKEPDEGEYSEADGQEYPEVSGNPTIALLDGLPLQNHELLADRLIVDDPDNWSEDYPASARAHGTSMASLLIHGDLNDDTAVFNRPVYVRPILKPVNSLDTYFEEVPRETLIVDLIHRCVKDLMDNDDPITSEIKIINLSIGDPSRQFMHFMSPLARLIDWLSYKYNLLFVISAGNHKGRIDTGLSEDDFDALSSTDRKKTIIRSIYEDARNRRLLSPAESINAITVGSAHSDNASIDNLGGRIDLYDEYLPSPISSFGSGYRRSVKPDLVYFGGKLLYRKSLLPGTTLCLEPAIVVSPPGNQSASTGRGLGALNHTAFSCGTSNATALISRSAGFSYDSLIEIFKNQAPDFDYELYIPSLLKAMVVHGCRWDEEGDNLGSILRTSENGRQLKTYISRWLGYGIPDIEKVLDCTEERATLLGFGSLNDEEAHVFKLPMPPSLSAKRELRKLTVTLAWFSPIAPTTQRYRSSSLWFEVEKDILAASRTDAEWRSVRRGTVQHEIFQGERAVALHDGDELEIKINCRKDASKIENPIQYGLVVSLEVAEGVDINIYNEIRTRIVPAVRVRQTL